MKQEKIISVVSIIMVVIISLSLAMIIFWLAGLPPLATIWTIIYGGFGRATGIVLTLNRTVPILFIGLAVILAFRAGLWNVGGEGQFYMGAIGATYVALFVELPMALHIPLMMIAAFIVGGAWGFIAGLLKAYLKVNEILSTLMMSYIAIWIAQYFCQGPWRDPGRTIAATAFFPDSARIPRVLDGFRLHYGIFIVMIFAFLVYLFLTKTVYGQKLQLMGLNLQAARYGVVNLDKTILLTMFISAGVAGLAGFAEVSGVFYNLQNGQYPISLNYGFVGIGAAMLGNLEVRNTVISSIFLGGLMAGASYLSTTTGLHAYTVNYVIGLMILLMIARSRLMDYFTSVLVRRLEYGR